MKPACEIMYMEKTPLMDVSQLDTEKTPDSGANPGGGMETESGEEVPGSSKGGFPWSDDFDFNMD